MGEIVLNIITWKIRFERPLRIELQLKFVTLFKDVQSAFKKNILKEEITTVENFTAHSVKNLNLSIMIVT